MSGGHKSGRVASHTIAWKDTWYIDLSYEALGKLGMEEWLCNWIKIIIIIYKYLYSAYIFIWLRLKAVNPGINASLMHLNVSRLSVGLMLHGSACHSSGAMKWHGKCEHVKFDQLLDYLIVIYVIFCTLCPDSFHKLLHGVHSPDYKVALTGIDIEKDKVTIPVPFGGALFFNNLTPHRRFVFLTPESS